MESLTTESRKWLEYKGISKADLDRLLEDHHIHGKAHDPDLIVTLCLNCHREITEGIAREGISMQPERNPQKLVALRLRATAVFFESLAMSFRTSATLLEDQSEEQ